MYPATRETNAWLAEDQRRRNAAYYFRRPFRWLLDRLGFICATFALLTMSWLLFDASRGGLRWERYKIEHHCVLRYKAGEAGENGGGPEGWLCAGPLRMIWKNPILPSVGGQI